MADFNISNFSNDLSSTGPRVGLALAQCGPFADPAATIDMAAKAERSGFASLWVMDRVLAPLEPRTPYPASMDGELPAEQYSVLDPFVALTLAATATERIRLGTSVIVAPWYSPLLLARTLTAIDLASNGRLSVGLGLGWSVDEYEAVCVALDHRGGRLDEIIDVLEAIWADGVTHVDGERYEIVPSEILPKPAQRPRPPLLLAAYTPSALDRVARRADAWIPAGLPIEAIGPMFGAVRDMAAGHGRDPDAIELVVRANASITTRSLDGDRPAYHGSIEQVADDLEATRRVGAHEIVVDLQGSAGTVDELLGLATAVTSPLLAAV